MPYERVLVVSENSDIGTLIEESILGPAGYEVTFVVDSQTAVKLASQSGFDLFIIGEKTDGRDGFELAAEISAMYPAVPIVMVGRTRDRDSLFARYGIWEVIPLPSQANEILDVVRQTISRAHRIREVHHLDSQQSIQVMHHRLETTEALQMVGRSVAGILELDEILSTVVDSAVEMTGAEEGSLLLLDDSTGQLYMHAARNFQDDFVRRFRLPIRDSLAGKVMRTGKPLALNTTEPQKIKTAYLVHTLIYVPLTVHNRVIGVLGVDNRQGGHPFKEEHLAQMITLADYAAIAIENARIYAAAEFERKKWESILTHVEDGVIVFDSEGRIMLANRSACSMFDIPATGVEGKPVEVVFDHSDLLPIFQADPRIPHRREVVLENGRVFNAQVSPIVDLGTAITFQEITHLKELDRIKSDFVNTVSHDLRSPLTAILGYIELIGRAGPVTDQQREYIDRVNLNVRSITALINDLLELGRIEAGFDATKEIVPLEPVICLVLDMLDGLIQARRLRITKEIDPENVTVLGIPNHLHQMIANLVDNAVKFSPPGSEIRIRTGIEANQIVLQVKDNGIGIPPSEQPYIFEKFYRASNVQDDTTGSGLGLAIVKTIVDQHGGRIWVDSAPGRGSTFTVVLPLADQTL